MKKAYVTPTIEKVEFKYEQSVVASGLGCYWAGEISHGTKDCDDNKFNGSWKNSSGQ